jgi:hypothetical protein
MLKKSLDSDSLACEVIRNVDRWDKFEKPIWLRVFKADYYPLTL